MNVVNKKTYGFERHCICIQGMCKEMVYDNQLRVSWKMLIIKSYWISISTPTIKYKIEPDISVAHKKDKTFLHHRSFLLKRPGLQQMKI